MMNTTDFPLSTTLPTTSRSTVSQSEERKNPFQQQQLRPLLRRRQDDDDDDDDDVLFFSTSSSLSHDDNDGDDDVATGSSSSSRDDVASVPAIVVEDRRDNYSISTPKRQKVVDGIFRPLSSSSLASSLSPPPLLQKSTTFYHDILGLSNDDLSFLALPDCPSNLSSSSQRISLAPRCLDSTFLPSSYMSSIDYKKDDIASNATKFKIMKGKRLFIIDEPEDDDNAEEYTEKPSDCRKENQDEESYNNYYNTIKDLPIPRTSRQEFLFRSSSLRNNNDHSNSMNNHHDRYSFINRRFVLKANNNNRI